MLAKATAWRKPLLAGAVTVALVGLLLLIWRGPWWFDGRYLSTPDLQRGSAALVTGFRTTLVQILAALGAVIALYFTARTYRLNYQGQVTDRFIKALERLGSDEIYVRIGGILAMEQIIRDAPKLAPDAAQVLHAFICERVPRASPQEVGRREPERDVQHALKALTRPSARRHMGTERTVELSYLHLAGLRLREADLTDAWFIESNLAHAYLEGANLAGAWLFKANLIEARLRWANLSNSRLAQANLTKASLEEANLSQAGLQVANLSSAQLNDALLNGADLTGAQLYEADLTGAQLGNAALTDAWLYGADLRSVHGLTVAQVLLANLNTTTQLPPAVAADPRVIARIKESESYPFGLVAEQEAPSGQ
ncbi:pentapeptide repeat-containing protein [Streptomyces luteireticuli]|uniref:Pentapeptide repeat-containing protein n=1 Tax=Streptomyces luteireticuli TaxID=173858 RepID=A0ABN0Z3Q3_9ACTN